MKLEIREKITGRSFTAYVEAWDVNNDGNYHLCYLIGHETFVSFHCEYIIYNNNDFNKKFEVVNSTIFRPIDNGFY